MFKAKKMNTKKEGKVVLKGGGVRWTKQDWRGLLAVIVLTGLAVSIILGRVDGIGTFGSLAGMVCRDYFEAKKNEQNET